MYVGHTGSGFTEQSLASTYKKLKAFNNTQTSIR